MPGIFFPKDQVGCELIPQLGGPGSGGDVSPSSLLHQRQGFLTWQGHSSRGGNFLPFQPMQYLVCGALETSSSG